MAGPEVPRDPSPAKLAAGIARARLQPPDQHLPGFYEQVLEWLDHPDETVREEAILFLGRHIRQRSDAQALLETLAGDPSVSVRKAAADCLGGVFRATRNRQVCEVLGGVTRNKEEEGPVRAAAFAAIKRINGY